MELAYTELQSEYNTYGGQVIMAKSDDKEPPAVPAKLADLADMAKKHGLTHELTKELSVRELEETFVGKARDSQTQRQSVTYAAFTTLQLHEPLLARDVDGQWYLVLKTEDQPARIPEFDEVQAEVTAAWKQNKAAELALEAAKDLADKAQKVGGSLSDFMSSKGYEVVTTDLFSARTLGTTPMEMRSGARLSEAPPLNAIGPEFLDEAFKLQPEQFVALQNHDHSDAYVVRLDRKEKTEDELRQLFLNEANSWFGARVMMASRSQQTHQELQRHLHERTGFDTERFTNYLQTLLDR